MTRSRHVESAPEYQGKRFRVRSWPGIAVSVAGWETEPDEDTEWSGCENRTGRLLIVMVGDDRYHAVDPDDLIEISRADYCGECGQIGCCHDGLDRGEDES